MGEESALQYIYIPFGGSVAIPLGWSELKWASRLDPFVGRAASTEIIGGSVRLWGGTEICRREANSILTTGEGGSGYTKLQY